METRRRSWAAALFVVVVMAGCGQEDPTDVGESLLPGGVRSYEVVLPAARFVVEDTAFSDYFDARATNFLILARDFQESLDANVMVQVTTPTFITARDSAGNAVTDSLPSFVGGRLHVILDSLSFGAGPDNAELRLYRLAEPYNPATANWTLRLDTGNVQLPWTEPGGTRGSPVSSGIWQPGSDTVTIEVDSATIAAWGDTLSPVRAMLLRAEDAGTRLRIAQLSMVLDAVSSIRSDTVFTAAATLNNGIFVFDPPPPLTTGGLYAGGAPAWRTMIRMKEMLDTLTLPCLDAEPGCSVLLRDASITAASLQFDAASPIPGYLPEDSIPISVRELYVTPTVPVERSPLGGFAGTARKIPPASFLTGAIINIPIGEYINRFTDDDDERPGPWVAVTGAPEGGTFGHAAFAGPPRLRLVLSVGANLQLR